MKTNDDQDSAPPPWKPLGPAIPKQAPLPSREAKRVAPGVLEGLDGRLYTDLPLPKF